MKAEIFRRSLRDRRRGLIGWAIGVTLLVVFNTAFFPSMKDTNFDEMIKDMPDFAKAFLGEQSLSSPAGFLESQFFLFMTPLLLLIFAIARGSDAIAGDEGRHTLDLLMANPVKRSRVLLEKGAAVLAGLAALAVIFLASLWISAQLFGLDIGTDELLVATAGSFGVAAAIGVLALTVGAATGKKGNAIGAASAVATYGYLVNSLGNQVESLESLRVTSPFYYGVGSSPLGGSITWADGIVLLGVVVVLLAAAAFLFQRRDLHV